MSTLLQTLYCASGRTRQVFTINDPATKLEVATNTAAGTHDASDTTRDEASGTGDFDTMNPILVYAVDYVVDTASASGTYDFVRVRLMQKKYCDTPASLDSASVRPLISTSAYGTPNTTQDETFTERSWDFATDPVDSQPWTIAKLTARRIGFRLSATALEAADTVVVAGSEIIVEVWGTTTTPQSSTPASVAGPALASDAAGVPGPVSSTPASVAGPALASDAAGVPGLRLVYPDSVGSALAPGGGVAGGAPSTFVQTGPRDPEAVITLAFQVIRPTGPPELGDANFLTGIGGDLIIGPAAGTTSIVATPIADPINLSGQILYLVFYTQGMFNEGTSSTLDPTDNRGIMDHVTAMRMKWALGGVTDQAVITPLRFGDDPEAGLVRATAAVATRPGGGAWTWADVAALVDLKTEADYNVPALHVLELQVNEMWIEVHGTAGIEPGRILLTQALDSVRRTQAMPDPDIRLTQTADAIRLTQALSGD